MNPDHCERKHPGISSCIKKENYWLFRSKLTLNSNIWEHWFYFQYVCSCEARLKSSICRTSHQQHLKQESWLLWHLFFPPCGTYGSKKRRENTQREGCELFREIRLSCVLTWKRRDKDEHLNSKSVKTRLCPQERRSGCGYAVWSELTFSVSIDVSELRGNPELTAGVSVIQYLQGTRKCELWSRRHRTWRSNYFSQHSWKKTRSGEYSTND